MAVILLTVGVIAITGAFSSGIYAAADSENTALALNIAQAQMEQIKNTPFASLASSGPTADAVFPRFSVTVNVGAGPDPKQVDVTVSWSVKGGQANVALTTLVANY